MRLFIRTGIIPRFVFTLLVSALLTTAAGAVCPVSLDVTGSIDAGDTVQTGRLVRNGVPSECGGKPFPGIFNTTPTRFDAYPVTNPTDAAVCVEVTTTITSSNHLFTVAYLGSFDPANIGANYLGDCGLSANSGGQTSFAVSVPAHGSIRVVVAETTPDSGGAYQLTVTCSRPAAPNGSVIIDEYRLRGPSGALDEYVDLYNNTDAPITTNPGWTLFSAGPGLGAAPLLTIPGGTVIPARGHLLLANELGYSLAGYPSGSGGATPDLTWTADIPDGSGLLLCRRPAASADFKLDAVGYVDDKDITREWTGLPSGGAERGGNPRYAFLRRVVNGVPQDTNKNEDDFIGVTTNGAATALPARLGAPGPRNLASPIPSTGGYLNTTDPLDPARSFDEYPNADSSAAAVTNGAQGTWEIRRAVTNTTGRPITRLRFRIADLSTYPPPSGIADLRAISSSSASVTRSDGTSVNVLGTTVEEPPVQAMGGGVNSTFSVPSVTAATPLAPGATIYVRFRFGIQQESSGTPLALDLTAEALPAPLPAQPNRAPVVVNSQRMVVRAGGSAHVAFNILDPDAGNAHVRLTVGAAHGTMVMVNGFSGSLSAGLGYDDSLFTVEGTLANINAMLDALYYRPYAGYTGTDTLNVVVNDLGAAGAGGPRQTSVSLPIIVSNGANVLAIAGGLARASMNDLATLDNIEDGRLDIRDAVRQAISPHAEETNVVVVSNATRMIGSGVFLDDPAINGRPDARVMAVHDYVANYVPEPLGVYYDALSQRWYVFTEAGIRIANGERIFYAFDGPLKRVVRPASNAFSHATYLDDASVNGQAGAPVLAQHEFRAASDTSPLGVWNVGASWFAYNEMQDNQFAGEAYIFGNPGADGGRVTRSAANAYSSYGVHLDDPRLNGRPDAVVIAQHKYVSNIVKSPMGVWYNTFAGKWVAYNELPGIPFPDGESVNYWVVR